MSISMKRSTSALVCAAVMTVVGSTAAAAETPSCGSTSGAALQADAAAAAAYLVSWGWEPSRAAAVGKRQIGTDGRVCR